MRKEVETPTPELKKKATALKKLCQGLDPYAPLSALQKKKLTNLGVQNLEDPFQLTNQLLLLLEDALEELETRKAAAPSQARPARH